MTEPTRLRDDGPDAVRALLRRAPPTRSMTGDERSRSRARVARAAAGLAAGAGTVAILQGAAIGAGLGLLTVGAAQVVPSWIAPRPTAAPIAPAPVRPPAPHLAPIPLPAPPAPDPPSSSSSAAPDPPPSRPATRPPSSSAAEAPSAGPAPSGDTLAEEVALLEKARTALGASPAQALALADSHAALYPAGKLAMEREMLAIDALVRLGRAGEARARAAPYLSGSHGSLYAERLRKLLDRLPP
jgi:hypothetical protein